METILFHYAHVIYIKWVRRMAERCEVAQPEWKPRDKTKPWGAGGGEIRDTCLGEHVWNWSICNEKSHFQKSRVRWNPGHFYQFAHSCLLGNKLDHTAKEKLVMTKILTVCHKKMRKKSASISLSLSLPTENTKQRHIPNVSALFDPWRNSAWCCWKYWIHWRKGRKHCLNYPVSCFSYSLPCASETWPSSEYIANRV